MTLSIVDKSPAAAGAFQNRASSQSAAIVEALAYTLGMVVDSVSDVITLTPEQIKPAPAMGSALDTDYLIGLGTPGQRMLILVDKIAA